MRNDIGIFSEQEQIINNNFFVLCFKEHGLLIQLLKHKEVLIQQLSGKIKDTDRPDYSIELMLAYNLSLLNGATNSLANGYLGVSQIILRTVLENACLAMYFYEFPKDEKKYRKSRKAFNLKLKALGYDTWIEGWLKRIDKEGKKFFKLGGEKDAWYHRIFTNMVSEASSFVHVDIDYIYGMVFMSSGQKQSDYALGPNWHGDLLVKNALWKIIEVCLYSCAVLDRVFKQHITTVDVELYSGAIEQLNNWKFYYNKHSKQKNVTLT